METIIYMRMLEGDKKVRLGFENIEYGKHILKETKAPENYEYNNGDFNFKVPKNIEDKEIEVQSKDEVYDSNKINYST